MVIVASPARLLRQRAKIKRRHGISIIAHRKKSCRRILFIGAINTRERGASARRVRLEKLLRGLY